MYEFFSAQLADARIADRLRPTAVRANGSTQWRVRVGETLVSFGQRVAGAGAQTAHAQAAPSATFSYC